MLAEILSAFKCPLWLVLVNLSVPHTVIHVKVFDNWISGGDSLARRTVLTPGGIPVTRLSDCRTSYNQSTSLDMLMRLKNVRIVKFHWLQEV